MGVKIDAINEKLDALNSDLNLLDFRVIAIEEKIQACPLYVKESLAQFNDEVTKVFDSNFKIVHEVKDMKAAMDQILEWMKKHV